MAKYRKHNQRYKFLAMLVVFVFVAEIMTRVCAYAWHNSMPVYHVMVPMQLLLYWLIFNSKLKSILMTFIFAFAFVFVLIYSIFLQSTLAFPSLSICFLSFTVILASLLDLRRLLHQFNQARFFENPDIWFNFGNIVFYSLTFFVFGLMNIGINIFPDWIYVFIFIANLILYVCYGIAIHYSGKEVTIDTLDHTN